MDVADTTPSNNPTSRRKYGISYSATATGVDSMRDDSTPLAPLNNDLKQRRFSSSFREKSRNFRIKMRRRSGTWFSTTEEHETSDLDLSYRSPSPAQSRCSTVSEDDTKSKTGSSKGLISMFTKRKSKLVREDSTHRRRRSDSDRQTEVANGNEHMSLSPSISAPSFASKRKDSKAVSVDSSIYEEESSYSDAENCATVETKNNNCVHSTNGGVHLSAVVENDAMTAPAEKKHKRGKIMKTLRHMMGKGKS